MSTETRFELGDFELQSGKVLKAMAGLATTMAWSQDWYRASGFERMGAATVEEFLKLAESFFVDWVPADTYHQTLTWMAADVSAHPKFDGDLDRALGAIRAKALIMPCDTDMYFRVADNEAEVAKDAERGAPGDPLHLGAPGGSARDERGRRCLRRCGAEGTARLGLTYVRIDYIVRT